MSPVELLHVDLVGRAYQARKIGQARVQHRVVVVAHQAVSQYLRVELNHSLRQHDELCATVVIVAVDRLAAVTARSHMSDRAWKLDSKRP